MKKLYIFSAFLFSLVFVSCKKDRSCSCVTSGGSSSGTPEVTKYIGVDKKTARANCVSSSWTSNGTEYTKTCTLSE